VAEAIEDYHRLGCAANLRKAGSCEGTLAIGRQRLQHDQQAAVGTAAQRRWVISF
jgi:hypothetical protein